MCTDGHPQRAEGSDGCSPATPFGGVADYALSLLQSRQRDLRLAGVLTEMARGNVSDVQCSALTNGSFALRCDARRNDSVIAYGGGLLLLVEP